MSHTLLDPKGFENRLSVKIKGLPDVNLDRDVISIRFSASRKKPNVLEVLLNSWEDASFKYSDGNILRIGAAVNLYNSTDILATGTITSLAPNFSNDNPPTLMFTVDAKRNRQLKQQKVHALEYGKELLEFHPVMSNIVNSAQVRIEATGNATGTPVIKPAAEIKISGVGENYSGLYKVDEVTHTLDSDRGYRTSFTCTRLQRRSTRALGKKRKVGK